MMMITSSKKIITHKSTALRLRKYLTYVVLMLFFKCTNTNTNVIHEDRNDMETYKSINYDSIMFSLLEEQHFETMPLSSNDTLIRVVLNNSFDNVKFFRLEKRMSSVFLVTKEIPHEYYNPFVQTNNMKIKYSFCKKAIDEKKWIFFIDALNSDSIKEHTREFVPDIDGEYVYIEIKATNKHIKSIINSPFPENIQRTIEFLKQNSTCD